MCVNKDLTYSPKKTYLCRQSVYQEPIYVGECTVHKVQVAGNQIHPE